LRALSASRRPRFFNFFLPEREYPEILTDIHPFNWLSTELSLDFSKNKEHEKRNKFKQGIVERLTTNLNPFCKGDAMKRLLKPRVSKRVRGFVF